MVIALIDSGVNKKEIPIDERNVCCMKYTELGDFVRQEEYLENEHGTEIASILYHEAPEHTQILSLRVLGDDNKCTITALLKALDFCMEKKVDIVNMSLGYAGTDPEKIKLLEEKCEEVKRQGIVIIAAHTNEEGKASYPASFTNVIGVKMKEDPRTLIKVDEEDKNIIFSQDYVTVKHRSKIRCRKGNSFICPLVSGWMCQLLQYNNGCYTEKDFFPMIQKFIYEELDRHIYVNRLAREEEQLMEDKKTLFFADRYDKDNQSIFQYFSGLHYNIDKGRGGILHKSLKELEDFVKMYDVLYISVLDVKYVTENYDRIINLIKMFMKHGKRVISIFSLLNTVDRILLVKSLHSDIKTIYK